MIEKIVQFIKYHNAVPLIVSVALVGAGGAFAATNPQAIFTKQQEILSVDNTYIVNKDLSTYTPSAKILSVTEDLENYYVAYSLSTINLDNYVWKDVSQTETMKISKSQLGKYDDLGLYVTSQLKQIIGRQLSYLHEVQNKEKQNVSSKVVATKYGGLIGKLLDNTTETLPGYIPVVVPPAIPPPVQEPLVSVPPNPLPAATVMPITSPTETQPVIVSSPLASPAPVLTTTSPTGTTTPVIEPPLASTTTPLTSTTTPVIEPPLASTTTPPTSTTTPVIGPTPVSTTTPI